MIQTLFDSRDFPVDERFDRWHDMTMRSVAASDVATEIPHQDFRATMQHLDLGAVQIVAMTYPSLRCWRTPRMIRQSDPGYLSLGMILEGKQGIAQSGRESVAGPDEFVLYDTSRPYEAHVTAATPVVARTVVAQFPRALLPARNFEQLLGARLPGRVGTGGLLAQFLLGLVRDARHYEPADSPRLATVFLDLLSITLARELGAGRKLPPESPQNALMLRIHAFIQQHLGDPKLSPVTIAAAHQISARHLHQLFRQQDLTVSAWIRRERLARCRRDLADPQLRGRPIHAIALRWGFPRPADFTRTFRLSYDMTPSDYREMVQHGLVGVES
ncbi:helix-turn-helix domain-containing protein [Micromonospora profundi]|uniref:AraC-like ligand-binding domain-containing protein n=1 Tax=Micromonospora profundi TaxID=1420889 RepID=UPI00364FB72C